MITYKNGDLLQSNCDIICHQTNCMGVMGAGIAKQIRKAYPAVYESYKEFCDVYGCDFVFGQTLLCPIGNGRYVANMFGQYGFAPRGVVHTDYDRFRLSCKLLKGLALYEFRDKRPVLGFPYKIGCGLAGGDWATIKGIIEEVFKDVCDVEIWKLQSNAGRES